MLPLACLTHWYDFVLYAIPMIALGGAVWFASWRERKNDVLIEDDDSWRADDWPEEALPQRLHEPAVN